MPRSNPEPISDAEIVQDLIDQMRKGVVPWRKPWASGPVGIIIGSLPLDATMWPSNVRAPKTPFGIFNGTMMLIRAQMRDYRTNLWVSAKVVEDLGAKIVDFDDRPTGTQTSQEQGEYRGSQQGTNGFFNIDQIKNCEATLGLTIIQASTNTKQAHFTKSEKLLAKLQDQEALKIEWRTLAAYDPSWDYVLMPRIEDFRNATKPGSPVGTAEANFWATMWHEVIHWTGHDSRLNRDRHVRWGDETYAFEELIAELGSSFLCARLGISGEMQHPSYLDSWCRQLAKESGQDGAEVLWKACKFASAARDFVLLKSTERQESRERSRGRP